MTDLKNKLNDLISLAEDGNYSRIAILWDEDDAVCEHLNNHGGYPFSQSFDDLVLGSDDKADDNEFQTKVVNWLKEVVIELDTVVKVTPYEQPLNALIVDCSITPDMLCQSYNDTYVESSDMVDGVENISDATLRSIIKNLKRSSALNVNGIDLAQDASSMLSVILPMPVSYFQPLKELGGKSLASEYNVSQFPENIDVNSPMAHAVLCCARLSEYRDDLKVNGVVYSVLKEISEEVCKIDICKGDHEYKGLCQIADAVDNAVKNISLERKRPLLGLK